MLVAAASCQIREEAACIIYEAPFKHAMKMLILQTSSVLVLSLKAPSWSLSG